jgi:signal transduction histidine kinase
MKLSIQYLQNAIQKGAPNVKELSANMAITLIEQIDQLSKIAGDFSQFANIGNASMERFDIGEVLASVINLYRSQPGIQIGWEKTEQACFIFSDKVQMNRLFTNLFQNAIEAETDQHATIVLNIQQQVIDGQVLLSISDRSGGIPENMQQDIFTPNFTTKTSGTGLGLAICKGIVEKANGTIWHESLDGIGATFFIKLPLAD